MLTELLGTDICFLSDRLVRLDRRLAATQGCTTANARWCSAESFFNDAQCSM